MGRRKNTDCLDEERGSQGGMNDEVVVSIISVVLAY